MDNLIPALVIVVGAHAWIHFAARFPKQWPAIARFPRAPLILGGWLVILLVFLYTVGDVVGAYTIEHHDPTHYPDPANPWIFWRRIVLQLAISAVLGGYLIRLGKGLPSSRALQ